MIFIIGLAIGILSGFFLCCMLVIARKEEKADLEAQESSEMKNLEKNYINKDNIKKEIKELEKSIKKLDIKENEEIDLETGIIYQGLLQQISILEKVLGEQIVNKPKRLLVLSDRDSISKDKIKEKKKN